ncbi:MAG: hypothetical protein MUF15_05565, partial [Acidobacteria bacterium]|nr:hypothetical protein [Acidobacteriota bacterium]
LIKLIDGSEKEKLEKIASGFIDELILKNDEWRSNGSFNNNLYFTNAALRMWFGYWEHHWRREEENNQQEDKKCNIMMIG